MVISKKICQSLILCVLILLFIAIPTKTFYADNVTSDLYTKVNPWTGEYIEGNMLPLELDDKPKIRPGFVGRNLIDEVISPDPYIPKFKGYAISTNDFGLGYVHGQSVIIKKVGTYESRPLALKISFTNPLRDATRFRISLLATGGVRVNKFVDQTVEYRLVYDDGKFNTPVQDVYVELPIESGIFGIGYMSQEKHGLVAVKSSNLKRFFFSYVPVKTNPTTNIINVGGVKPIEFNDVFGKTYIGEALALNQKPNSPDTSPYEARLGKNTFIFDNNEPLVIRENLGNVTGVSYSTLFKETLSSPVVLDYLPPRVTTEESSAKFELNFELIQSLVDGYAKFFPDSLSLVMDDYKNIFTNINLSSIDIRNKDNKDISQYIEISQSNDHKAEFRVLKDHLIQLGSNQLIMNLSANNLNVDEVKKYYDDKEGVYKLPIRFYNYKMYKGIKKESEKVEVIAKIRPDIYAEPADNVEAEQFSSSGDLDVESLLKNTLTTIIDDSLTKEIVDKTINFDDITKVYNVKVKVSSKITSKQLIISVPVKIKKAEVVTLEHFDKQKWLIDEIERQIPSKKIGINLIMRDLLKIETIDLTTGSNFIGQHIPKTINSLKNLSVFKLKDKQLVGNLPEEIGDLLQLKVLSLSGNQFSGTLPTSYEKLKNLTLLRLDNNALNGTIPEGIGRLENLKGVHLSHNNFVGQLPSFTSPPTEFDVSYTQLTYNNVLAPSFIPTETGYEQTLIRGKNSLGLSGKNYVSLTNNVQKIKPFLITDEGYVDIHLRTSQTNNRSELFKEHQYTFINKTTQEIMYKGKATVDLTISVSKGNTYQVILDEASNNPNNVFEFTVNLRELKLNNVPKQVSIDTIIGDTNYQVVTVPKNDDLVILDNRAKGSWSLKMKPSELKSDGKVLKGSYYYKTKSGSPVELSANTSKEIEKGENMQGIGLKNVTENWNDQQGLLYRQTDNSNYKGEYKGNILWLLENVPK